MGKLDKTKLLVIDFFFILGYFKDSLAISKFLTRREMCFNGDY